MGKTPNLGHILKQQKFELSQLKIEGNLEEKREIGRKKLWGGIGHTSAVVVFIKIGLYHYFITFKNEVKNIGINLYRIKRVAKEKFGSS